MENRIKLAIALGIGLLLSFPAQAAVASASVSIPSGPDFTRLDALFKKYGAQYGVNWKWLKAISIVESGLGTNPLVKAGKVSSDGLSYGVMQLTLTTARGYEPNVGYTDLNNAETSIRIAAKFVAWIIKQFASEPASTLPQKVFMSYNQGVAGTKRGYTAALPYWNKIFKALTAISEQQPGQ